MFIKQFLAENCLCSLLTLQC